MTCLSSCVLGSTWPSPPKRFFECSPNSYFHWSHSLLRFFWANFRKGSVQGSADHSSHLSPTGMLLHSNSLEGSANFALHLSQSRVNCWHVSPMEIQSGETTHHVVAVGVFFGLISLNLVGESQKKNQRLSPKTVWRHFSLVKLFTIFLGNSGVYVQGSLVESLVSTNLPKKLNTSLLLKKRKHIFWDMFPKHFSHLVIFIGGTSESNFSEQVLATRLKIFLNTFLRISAIIFLKHISGVYTNIPSICNKTSSRRHLITILHKKSNMDFCNISREASYFQNLFWNMSQNVS